MYNINNFMQKLLSKTKNNYQIFFINITFIKKLFITISLTKYFIAIEISDKIIF